jgi:hypothetical protein
MDDTAIEFRVDLSDPLVSMLSSRHVNHLQSDLIHLNLDDNAIARRRVRSP